MAAEIRIRSLEVSYATESGLLRPAIGPLTFDVTSAKCLAIVGPSGCGKTTLLKVLAGIIPHAIDTVTYLGDRSVAKVAYIPQSPQLLPWRTAFQNGCIGAEVHEELGRQGVLDRVEALFDKFRMRSHRDVFAPALSGGMAQRVSLIRALASAPTVLLCDEPFSSVDFVSRFDLTSEFKRHCIKGTTTTVLVTHNIEEAIFLGDEILVLSGGPGKVIARIPVLDQDIPDRHDFVECRKTAQFAALFQSVWNHLKAGHAAT